MIPADSQVLYRRNAWSSDRILKARKCLGRKVQQMQLVTYTGLMQITSPNRVQVLVGWLCDVMLYGSTRLGTGRRLTMSIEGQGNKIYVNQAFVDIQVTKIVSNKKTTSRLREGFSCLCRCSQNGGIVRRSGLCHRHRSRSTRGTTCCFGSTTPTSRRVF